MPRPFGLMVSHLVAVTMALSLIAACGGAREKNKRSPATCEGGQVSDAGESLTLYKREFAAFGEKCADIAFTGSISCDKGRRIFLGGGSPSCQETELKQLSIRADSDHLEIGQTMALVVEGTDQRGGTAPLDSKLVTWSTSDSSVQVSKSGIVSGKMELSKIEVTAEVGDQSAKFTLSIVGKSCQGTPHGSKKEFSRFKSERVPFGASCQALSIEGTCANGTFTFPEGASETCAVAQLSQLVADPASLFLKKGASAPVALYFVDEIGTQIPLATQDATWDVPADFLRLDGNKLTALNNLPKDLKVKIAAKGFNTEVTVSGLDGKPYQIRFAEKTILLKKGDEKNLEVKSIDWFGGQTIEGRKLNWESSDPTKVSVANGLVKAVAAAAKVTILARLGDQEIQSVVEVEEELSIDAQAIGQPLLTQNDPSLLPAYTATIKGPREGKKPELRSITPGCEISLHQNRSTWELDVGVDEERKHIPANCEVDLVMESKAGQTATQKIKVPVDYRRINLTEVEPQVTPKGIEVARIDFKLSDSYEVKKAEFVRFDNSEISPKDCEISLQLEEGAYSVVAKSGTDTSRLCAGYVHLAMYDSNDKLTGNFYDLVTISKYPSFADLCKFSDSDAVQGTVGALRQIVGPSARCEKLAEVLRSKNLQSVWNKASFSLAMASKKVTDLEPLARFVGLKELDLANNRELVDVTPIEGLKLLTLVNLKLTAVQDFSPLFQHTLMDDLRLPKNAVIACSETISNPEIKKVCK